MFMFPLPAAVPQHGSCLALPALPCRLHSQPHLRAWQPAQNPWQPMQLSSSQDTSVGHRGNLSLPCDGDSRVLAGFNVKEKSHLNFSKEFVSYSEIQNAASWQGLSLRLETVGPFFRVQVVESQSKEVLGVAQGLVKVWISGRILHLDSVRLNLSSLKAKRPIFGIAFLLGAVAVRHGYDQHCVKAELLAIKDTDNYHTKLVRYYTRMGFKSIYDVTGDSLQDLPHMLIWGGVGTRMDASIEELLTKWSPAIKKVTKK